MNFSDYVVGSVKTNKKSWLQSYARFGLAAKGVVYCLIGGLAAMTAFGIGGGQTGSPQDAFKFLYDKPMGVVMLIVLAIGLVGYAVWRFIQAFKDPDHNGKDKKGIVKRIGFGISGFVYLGFAFYIVQMLIKSGSSSGGSGQQQAVAELLSKPFGQIAVIVIGAIIIIRGITHIYKAYTGKFKKNIDDGSMNPKARKFFDRAGKIGFTARGVVWSIIGFFFVQAGLKSDAGQVENTSGAFDFLQSTGGSVLLGVVALGFLGYGLFMFIEAKYRRVRV